MLDCCTVHLLTLTGLFSYFPVDPEAGVLNFDLFNFVKSNRWKGLNMVSWRSIVASIYQGYAMFDQELLVGTELTASLTLLLFECGKAAWRIVLTF